MAAAQDILAEHGLTGLLRPPTIDLHADTALHGLPLRDEELRPGVPMRLFLGVAEALAPGFARQLTRRTLDAWGAGLQILSLTSEGLPPFFRTSHRAYTQLVVGRPRFANATRLNTLVDQAAYVYREVAANADRLALARSYEEVVRVIASGRIAVRLAVEGAAPLVPGPDDLELLWRYRDAALAELPPALPWPARHEVVSLEGRIAYLERLGVFYVGLNHLSSSPFCGSDMFGSPRRKSGISAAGGALIAALEQAGIVVDLAHASHRAQAEVARLATRPLLVSHAHLETRSGRPPTWRSLTAAGLAAIRDSRGLVGVMLARRYLPHDNLADVVAQVDALVAALGDTGVALGSDADGFVRLVVGDLGRLDAVLEALQRHGYAEAALARVRFGNALAFMRRYEAGSGAGAAT